MISLVQPLHAGNALRLFIQPPTGAHRWRVLRKASNAFADVNDPDAIQVYDGSERSFVDVLFLQNGILTFYCPFYSADGLLWAPGSVASGTPQSSYIDRSVDPMTLLRERLELGLKVEVERGNLIHELGYIPVFVASPSMDQELRLPVVTVHLDSEDPIDAGIGEQIEDGDFDDSEGWLSSVQITVTGWSLNGDERMELRKALRRVVVANLPVLESFGLITPRLSNRDIDSVNGEFPTVMYQSACAFTCVAPVYVTAPVETIHEVLTRRV